MQKRFRLGALVLAFSALCGFIGYTSGAPATMGPCNTDKTNTCAFTCVPSGQKGAWIESTDNTQVPYCASTNKNVCNPKALFMNCSVDYYSDAACTKFVINDPVMQTPICK